MTRVWQPQVVASVMLLWALYPENPYGYYVFLRIVCCGVFAFLASRAVEANLRAAGWVFGLTAVLYNPLIPVHLPRELWSIINIVTICIAAASILVLPPKTAVE